MDQKFFDTKWDRWGQDASKWDMTKVEGSPFYTPVAKEEVVPMWVADLDFATAPSVIEALKERIDHPLFGYFPLPQRYIDAIANWQKTRYGVEGVERKHIMYQNSVLGGVASFVYAYSQPGDNILINQTTYTGFQATVKGSGRFLVYSDLKKDENGIPRLDLEDMEAKIIANNIPIFIFCSPHNPTGRVWTKEEIESVVELCAKHDVMIMSDEIWADFIVNPACKHVATQSVSETAKKITMGMYAPSKTFNLAGLVGSYSLIYCPTMARKITKVATSSHYNMANVLSVYALIGAYEGGAEYVDEMNKYIRKNQEELADFFLNKCEGLETDVPDGTYLLWVSVEKTGMDVGDVIAKMKEVGVIVNDGRTFHGKTHLRFNCACPNSFIKKAIEKLTTVFPQK